MQMRQLHRYLQATHPPIRRGVVNIPANQQIHQSEDELDIFLPIRGFNKFSNQKTSRTFSCQSQSSFNKSTIQETSWTFPCQSKSSFNKSTNQKNSCSFSCQSQASFNKSTNQKKSDTFSCQSQSSFNKSTNQKKSCTFFCQSQASFSKSTNQTKSCILYFFCQSQSSFTNQTILCRVIHFSANQMKGKGWQVSASFLIYSTSCIFHPIRVFIYPSSSFILSPIG